MLRVFFLFDESALFIDLAYDTMRVIKSIERMHFGAQVTS